MSPKSLLRGAAIVSAIFLLGHTMGWLSQPEGAQVPVAEMMKRVSFSLFGAERTYWTMFKGYGLFVVVAAALSVALWWLLSRMPLDLSRPLIVALAVAQLGYAYSGFVHFFWAPGAFNLLAAALGLAAAAQRRLT